MKKINWIAVVIMMVASCNKSDVAGLPTLITANALAITSNGATSGGNITSDGGAAITERGICYNTTTNPTTADNKVASGNGTGIFSADLTGLTDNTIYFTRAYAINSIGTSYGQEVQFTTEIESVTIGTQTWMKKNLDVTKYRNGDVIPQVSDAAAWAALSAGAWCYYNNDPSNEVVYGKLYNWSAINDTRNIAPLGWHVPTDTEWTTLLELLGGELSAGGELKETGTTHWNSPNAGATNSSNFTGYPGAFRAFDGTFSGLGIYGTWWTGTEIVSSTDFAWSYQLISDGANINRGISNKYAGYSVRCLKD